MNDQHAGPPARPLWLLAGSVMPWIGERRAARDPRPNRCSERGYPLPFHNLSGSIGPDGSERGFQEHRRQKFLTVKLGAVDEQFEGSGQPPDTPTLRSMDATPLLRLR